MKPCGVKSEEKLKIMIDHRVGPLLAVICYWRYSWLNPVPLQSKSMINHKKNLKINYKTMKNSTNQTLQVPPFPQTKAHVSPSSSAGAAADAAHFSGVRGVPAPRLAADRSQRCRPGHLKGPASPWMRTGYPNIPSAPEIPEVYTDPKLNSSTVSASVFGAVGNGKWFRYIFPGIFGKPWCDKWRYPNSWLVYFRENSKLKWMMIGGSPMT